jgi:hypothetical protein
MACPSGGQDVLEADVSFVPVPALGDGEEGSASSFAAIFAVRVDLSCYKIFLVC